jgi:5-formyltetrahydrofolate cyclo-ligase
MNAAELKRAKREIRRRVLALRDAVPAPERARRGAIVLDRFLSLPEVEGARTVMIFWSFGSEVPTAPVIERLQDDRDVALPRIESGDLVAVRFEAGGTTRPTAFGAEEPDGGSELEPGSIDVVAVPGVAFDRRGGRIGYGRGFYDRFLRRTTAFTVGLAFDVQLVDRIPRGRFDVDVDAVVTESETIRPRPRSDLNSRSRAW